MLDVIYSTHIGIILFNYNLPNTDCNNFTSVLYIGLIVKWFNKNFSRSVKIVLNHWIMTIILFQSSWLIKIFVFH